MDIYSELKAIGLHKSEISVYLYLLENGLSTPPTIAKDTGIARTNCYNILQTLKEKDLIEEHEKGRRKAYIASDPGAILRSLERKKDAITRVLPDLRSLYTIQKNKPKIKFFDGLAQVEQIYLATLSAEEIYGIGSTKQLSGLTPKFYSEYLQKIKDHNIVFHDILSSVSSRQGAPEMKETLKGLYEARFLPERHGDFPTDMLIWADNVALITLEEPIFGTILTNPLLAKTFRNIFHTMWASLSSHVIPTIPSLSPK